MCAVPQWVRPAYDAICRRPESLSPDEGRRLGWDRYAAICRIREDLARGTLIVPVGNYDYLVALSKHSAARDAMNESEHSPSIAPATGDTPDGASLDSALKPKKRRRLL